MKAKYNLIATMYYLVNLFKSFQILVARVSLLLVGKVMIQIQYMLRKYHFLINILIIDWCLATSAYHDKLLSK